MNKKTVSFSSTVDTVRVTNPPCGPTYYKCSCAPDSTIFILTSMYYYILTEEQKVLFRNACHAPYASAFETIVDENSLGAVGQTLVSILYNKDINKVYPLQQGTFYPIIVVMKNIFVQTNYNGLPATNEFNEWGMEFHRTCTNCKASMAISNYYKLFEVGLNLDLCSNVSIENALKIWYDNSSSHKMTRKLDKSPCSCSDSNLINVNKITTYPHSILITLNTWEAYSILNDEDKPNLKNMYLEDYLASPDNSKLYQLVGAFYNIPKTHWSARFNIEGEVWHYDGLNYSNRSRKVDAKKGQFFPYMIYYDLKEYYVESLIYSLLLISEGRQNECDTSDTKFVSSGSDHAVDRDISSNGVASNSSNSSSSETSSCATYNTSSGICVTNSTSSEANDGAATSVTNSTYASEATSTDITTTNSSSSEDRVKQNISSSDASNDAAATNVTNSKSSEDRVTKNISSSDAASSHASFLSNSTSDISTVTANTTVASNKSSLTSTKKVVIGPGILLCTEITTFPTAILSLQVEYGSLKHYYLKALSFNSPVHYMLGDEVIFQFTFPDIEIRKDSLWVCMGCVVDHQKENYVTVFFCNEDESTILCVTSAMLFSLDIKKIKKGQEQSYFRDSTKTELYKKTLDTIRKISQCMIKGTSSFPDIRNSKYMLSNQNKTSTEILPDQKRDDNKTGSESTPKLLVTKTPKNNLEPSAENQSLSLEPPRKSSRIKLAPPSYSSSDKRNCPSTQNRIGDQSIAARNNAKNREKERQRELAEKLAKKELLLRAEKAKAERARAENARKEKEQKEEARAEKAQKEKERKEKERAEKAQKEKERREKLLARGTVDEKDNKKNRNNHHDNIAAEDEDYNVGSFTDDGHGMSDISSSFDLHPRKQPPIKQTVTSSVPPSNCIPSIHPNTFPIPNQRFAKPSQQHIEDDNSILSHISHQCDISSGYNEFANRQRQNTFPGLFTSPGPGLFSNPTSSHHQHNTQMPSFGPLNSSFVDSSRHSVMEQQMIAKPNTGVDDVLFIMQRRHLREIQSLHEEISILEEEKQQEARIAKAAYEKELRIAEQEAKKEQRISDALLQTELRISASNRLKSEKKQKTKAYGLGGAFDN